VYIYHLAFSKNYDFDMIEFFIDKLNISLSINLWSHGF